MKTMTDGSAVFAVRDKRMQAIIDIFYPIGTVYMSADKSKTKADFHFMQYGTWEEVPANLCLQTGAFSEAGTQRGAGLPNITGSTGVHLTRSNTRDAPMDAFYWTDNDKKYNKFGGVTGNSQSNGICFDASKSNPIYGSSNTVQPPAYMVRAWVRTA